VHLVIGTGQPRQMDFAIADRREAIPAGWEIYATFSGDYAFAQLDEQLFDAMTDEEFFTFRALADEAREREARRLAERFALVESLFSKLRGWLFGRPVVAGTKQTL
jgi:hypothetical protein